VTWRSRLEPIPNPCWQTHCDPGSILGQVDLLLRQVLMLHDSPEGVNDRIVPAIRLRDQPTEDGIIPKGFAKKGGHKRDIVNGGLTHVSHHVPLSSA
jgi:hypothetical protein